MLLADLARGSMRKKTPALIEALTGQFTDHHGFLLDKMLTRVQTLDGDIAAVEAQIAQHLTPVSAETAQRLDEIPGVGLIAAWVIIAEIGLDMTRFPTPGHLCSWAKFAPGVNVSAGKKVGTAATGHGNRYLARVLGEIAVGVGRTNTFLGARYRRLARRAGKKKAIVATGRQILVIIWHLLSTPGAFRELGVDYYETHVNSNRRVGNHIRDLQALGYNVTLEPPGIGPLPTKGHPHFRTRNKQGLSSDRQPMTTATTPNGTVCPRRRWRPTGHDLGPSVQSLLRRS